jgi:hypothetical protein
MAFLLRVGRANVRGERQHHACQREIVARRAAKVNSLNYGGRRCVQGKFLVMGKDGYRPRIEPYKSRRNFARRVDLATSAFPRVLVATGSFRCARCRAQGAGRGLRAAGRSRVESALRQQAPRDFSST